LISLVLNLTTSSRLPSAVPSLPDTPAKPLMASRLSTMPAGMPPSVLVAVVSMTPIVR
jgi:hypothetical protein